MKNKRGILFLVTLLVVSIFLTGCGDKKPADPGNVVDDGGSDNAKEVKDSVIIAISGEPTTLDPSEANELITFKLNYQIYDTLLREEQDGSLVAGLADEWEISEDGQEYTFHLKKDVKFHNGEIMTADDVVFSYERSIASSFTSRITGVMDRMEKIDDHTVVLYLKHPYGPALGCTAHANLGIVNKKAVLEDEEGFGRNPVGTGPYMFKDWKSGDRLFLERFEDYYRGAASIKELTYRIIAEASTTLVALEKGDIDVIMTPMPSDREHIIENEKLEISEIEDIITNFITFNTEKGTFSDRLLRQAVSYAVDRDALIIGALEGLGTPLHTPIPPGIFGFFEDFRNNEYNPEKAKELLVQAGYPDGLEVTMRTMEAAYYTVPTEIIQEQLRRVGIKVKIELMERGAYLQDVSTDNNYEITFLAISPQVPDADQITYVRFHSDLVGGGNNYSRFSNSEMDKALEIGRESLDEQERLDAYYKVCEIVKEEAPIIPLYVGMRMIAYNGQLEGVQAHPLQKYFVYDWNWK